MGLWAAVARIRPNGRCIARVGFRPSRRDTLRLTADASEAAA